MRTATSGPFHLNLLSNSRHEDPARGPRRLSHRETVEVNIVNEQYNGKSVFVFQITAEHIVQAHCHDNSITPVDALE